VARSQLEAMEKELERSYSDRKPSCARGWPVLEGMRWHWTSPKIK
jgi:hypothetical protein